MADRSNKSDGSSLHSTRQDVEHNGSSNGKHNGNHHNGRSSRHDRENSMSGDEVEPVARNDSSANLRDPEEETAPTNAHLTFTQRSLRISWSWFPVNMSTGALSILLSQQPFTFPGLLTIGKIFYLINLVLFCIFVGLMITRFARKPEALAPSIHHPSEGFFFGSFWVAVALFLLGIQVYGVPACGPWLVRTMRVLFWMYYVAAAMVAVLQYHIIFEVERLRTMYAMPAWVLPAYPFLVVGTLAAQVASTQPRESAQQIIIAGIAGQGLGWTLAFFIYTVYLNRLITSALPRPSIRPGMYISVGPAAYTCAGLISLGKQAMVHIPPDYLGTSGNFPVGEVWMIMSVPAALFLWLIAVWFSALSTVTTLRGVRNMDFALEWWAFVFPNVGLTLATILLGQALESKALKIVGSALTVVLVILWLVCFVAHARALWNKELLAPGKDAVVEDVNAQRDVEVVEGGRKRLRRRWQDDEDRDETET